MDKEERKMILRMLEEGKITLEEADILIKALGFTEEEDEEDEENNSSSFTDREDDDRDNESYSEFKEQMKEIRDTINDGLSGVKKDLKRMQTDFEKSPMGENIGIIWSSIIDSFHSSFGSSYKFEDALQGEFSANSEEEIEIQIKVCNGEIIIEPSLDDSYDLLLYTKVKAESQDRAKEKKEEELKIIRSDNKLEINAPGKNMSTSVRLLLPKKYIYGLNLDSSNGRIYLGGLETNLLKASSSNGSITFKKLKGQDLVASTSNGRIEMLNILADSLQARTSNGSIYIDGKGSLIKGSTSNGSVTIKPLVDEDAEIIANTSNGKIKISLPLEEDVGFAIRANTSMGSIHFDMDDLNYVEQTNVYGKKSVVVNSKDWQEKAKKIKVEVKTSMGSIHVGTRTKEDLCP